MESLIYHAADICRTGDSNHAGADFGIVSPAPKLQRLLSYFLRGKGEERPPSECLFLDCLFLEQWPVLPTFAAPVRLLAPVAVGTAPALVVGTTMVVFQLRVDVSAGTVLTASVPAVGAAVARPRPAWGVLVSVTGWL